ncbi:NADPH-dependent F420 reductase [Hydrogenophaga sp.]|uniref:NADPH-dependent F420 reductase n=1 Tax=Hydrogenophaga sp. TaxID=1904254 RepID=UPI00272907B8|nr:NADPH-dependent F420 reductase [Hydrogenophaga sp.]MDO9433942.1 NADPH-dependent F420 reductase [Hydrogenophaga sp.]
MTTPSKAVVAVIGGTGEQGSGLALRLAKAGYAVVIGSRDAAKGERTCDTLAASASVPRERLSHGPYREAAARADIVVLTVPYAAQRTAAEEILPVLNGRIVVDATVPLKPPKVSRVQLPAVGSAVLELQGLLGDQARLVSAFQNVSAKHLLDLDHTLDCDVLVAGDDADAREAVVQLAADIGLTAWHAGPLCNSAAAEALTSVLIAINMRYKVPGAGIRITGMAAAGPR